MSECPIIRYGHYSSFPGWGLGPAYLAGMIDRYHPKVVLEIGSGVNPTLDIDSVVTRQLCYITSDCSADELAKAPPGYEARQIDLEASAPDDLVGSCDMVFSRMVNEHIRDGRRYHTNIMKLLRPGGLAIHCFASMYALPFIINRLMPEFVSARLLAFVRPNEERGKFHAYYSWSRGPTQTMVRRFQKIGYDIISYEGFFGHPYYEVRLPWLHRLEQMKAHHLLRHPQPHLCAFVTLVLQRPA